MNVGLLIIENEDFLGKNHFDAQKISKILSLKGYDVKLVINIDFSANVEKTIEYLRANVNAVIVCGNSSKFYDYLSENYSISKSLSVLETDGFIYAFMHEYSERFILDLVIPAFNSKCKTFYNTVIIKTLGKTAAQIKEILKDYLKGKHRITFRFIEDFPECEVQIKYSSKMQKIVVDGIITGIVSVLQDITYAHSDISLAYQVADFLKVHNKKICVAESFTGGGIVSELIKIPGISANLKEGIVAYSNESKIKRLNVEENIIEHYGAVSIETVYEMAANILLDNNCDISVATTGNAGPTAEKEGENGLCFIAVGNKRGIHIYKYNFEGDREFVIKCGIKTALFNLYKKLNESEFMELLKLQEQKISENNQNI